MKNNRVHVYDKRQKNSSDILIRDLKHDNSKPLFLVSTNQRSKTSEIDKNIGLAHLKFGKSTRLWNQKAGPVFSKVKRGSTNCGSRLRNELKSRNEYEYPP